VDFSMQGLYNLAVGDCKKIAAKKREIRGGERREETIIVQNAKKKERHGAR
jgi:hypothetical protein